MKIQWKKLIIAIAIPLLVGAVSAFFTQDAMSNFGTLNQPPLSPPGWLFPIVWTLLYTLMGIASYLVVTSGKPYGKAITVYALQLFFNFFWSIIFFNLQQYLLAFIWLIILWVLIIITTILFFRIRKSAGILMLPYLLWVTFAAYLNLGIYLLN